MANVSECTLFVRNIPLNVTKEKFEDIFSEIGPLKRCFIVRDKDNQKISRGFGYVTYALKNDAELALKRIKTIDGQSISVKYANKRVTKEKSNDEEKETKQKKPHTNKNARVIIRNLSFKADESCVRKTFSKYGKILEVTIPTKKDGKRLGFCFVQFVSMASANNAIKEMNAKEILDRVIAVDWAIPKDKFLNATHNSSNDSGNQVEIKKEIETIENVDIKEEVESVAGDEVKTEDVDDNESDFDSIMNASDSDSEDDETETESDEEESNSESESDDSEEETDEDDDDDDESEDGRKRKFKNVKSDVNEGKTVFVRNLNFDTDENDLKSAFDEFGKIKYAVICVDPDTEHPKGTAFVQFFDKEAAEKCVAKASAESGEGGIEIDGRRINVSMALSREEIQRQAAEKHKKEPKDNRNLYLAREGLIRMGSRAAEGVSKADLAQRAKVEVWKRQMLKNLNVFISKSRLCVRNLPPHVNNAKLRKIFLKAGGNGAKITEARVIYNTKPIDGIEKSKEFGFVTFTDHENALRALRATNNNPNIFSKDKRPIVEFSLEKKGAVNAKIKRMQKSREKLHVKSKESDQNLKGFLNTTRNVKKRNDIEDESSNIDDSEFVGAKGLVGVKGGLPSHVGPKIRHKNRQNQNRMLKNNKRKKPDKGKQRKRRKFEN